jgi:hypothetical protein
MQREERRSLRFVEGGGEDVVWMVGKEEKSLRYTTVKDRAVS